MSEAWATRPQYKQGSLVVDASQFGQADICLDIQAAIATLPTSSTPGTTGAVIDARNFAPSATQSFLTCSVNPFALYSSTLPMNPIVLVGSGYSGGSAPTPGSLGGILLLPGATIAVNVPWLVPQNWSIIGESAGLTQLAPSSSFPNTTAETGTVTSAGTSSAAIGGTSTSWTSSGANSVIGAILLACPTSCSSATYQNATIVGIVTSWTSGTAIA